MDEIGLDDEWNNFLLDQDNSSDECMDIKTTIKNDEELILNCPKPNDIYISTKSKIAYLNVSTINLYDIFWKIPVLDYGDPVNGVIKKQMKFNSTTEEELNSLQEKLLHQNYYTQQIITNINNPTGRIKFKDIRKINIGICTKDIMSYRIKEKSAFYNCFVLIIRMKTNDIFKEFHVKIFNTGKMEIPGIQSDKIYNKVLDNVIMILSPYLENIGFTDTPHETILINSNFNCGFYINREKLYNIIRSKYKLQCIYDPCSYPGIQCKYYYNPEEDNNTNGIILDDYKNNKKIVKVSFMIFRTGSILIVGKCDEDVLRIVYNYIVNMLTNEFQLVNQNLIMNNDDIKPKKNKQKIRKKTIFIENTKS